MLILTRGVGESITMGNDIKVTLLTSLKIRSGYDEYKN